MRMEESESNAGESIFLSNGAKHSTDRVHLASNPLKNPKFRPKPVFSLYIGKFTHFFRQSKRVSNSENWSWKSQLMAETAMLAVRWNFCPRPGKPVFSLYIVKFTHFFRQSKNLSNSENRQLEKSRKTTKSWEIGLLSMMGWQNREIGPNLAIL
jgi:hypothetical protein